MMQKSLRLNLREWANVKLYSLTKWYTQTCPHCLRFATQITEQEFPTSHLSCTNYKSNISTTKMGDESVSVHFGTYQSDSYPDGLEQNGLKCHVHSQSFVAPR